MVRVLEGQGGGGVLGLHGRSPVHMNAGCEQQMHQAGILACKQPSPLFCTVIGV